MPCTAPCASPARPAASAARAAPGSQNDGAAKMTPSAPRVLTCFSRNTPFSSRVVSYLAAVDAERCRKAFESSSSGLPFGGDVVQQPARHQHEVVVDDVAARHLDRLDQAERRLLAERAGQHDARVVALRPRQRVGRGNVLADELRVLLGRQHHAGAQHQVDLGGRRLPRLLRAVRIQVADRGAVLVEDVESTRSARHR